MHINHLFKINRYNDYFKSAHTVIILLTLIIIVFILNESFISINENKHTQLL